MPFVHLHTHSEYSLLDGANKLDALIDRAVELKMPALALTDHGNMHGAWHFYEKAKARGIKPIIGCEAYVAFGDLRSKERPPDAPGDYHHLVLLARNREGYRNLVKLTSIAHTEGFYRRPRIDKGTLEGNAAGLLCLSACLSGELALYLRLDQYEKAKEAAGWYAGLLGEGNYYLEVQNHGIPGQEKVNTGIFQLGEELGLPVLATNDAHYLRREDADAHDILLCIGTGKDRSDPKRLRFHGQESYFKSAEEMAEAFPGRPDLLETTLQVAERCDVEFEKKVFLPEFPRPEGYTTADNLLRDLAEQGARERYGDPLPEEVRERLDYELDVITGEGYSGYFLIVWDFIRAARERGVPVGPGRGSAAGSLVAYSLKITDVDPLQFDLIFERFLNPARVSMPDIDVDFCYERRGEIIDYVREKYGNDSVGQIITFGTMQSRAVVRDVGRTLGFTPAETDRVAKLIPSSPGYSPSLDEAVERVEELRALYSEDPRYRELLDYGKVLEGLARHTSVHAAGVVIAPGPLSDYVPTMTATTRSGAGNGGGAGSGDGNGELVITQYDMVSLEKAGMLKFDFLGLRTLTVIHDAMAMIRARHDVEVDWDEIGLDDPDVFEMLASGRTAGVFQFESALGTDKLRAMRCDRFDDLIAVNALIRPGTLDSGMTDVYIRRKRGEEEVDYPHESLKEILEPTYGVITYQEQVMRAANAMAGFSMAEADVLRKAVGKKDPVLIRKELNRFVDRATQEGVQKRKAEQVASLLETFGRYGFNKAHATAYAMISYRTAWLKCHYPAEFMAALLSAEIGNTDKVVGYINHCSSLGLEVLPPHVNQSGYRFTVVGKDEIRFGLGAIKGVGRSAIESIRTAREADGPFTSLFDFCKRVDLRLNNRRVIEALIGAGALDGLGSRAAMEEGLERTLGEAQFLQREKEAGQVSLFASEEIDAGTEPTLPQVPEWSEAEKLRREKELVGFFVSGHPLDSHRDLVELYASRANASNLVAHRDRKVEIACVITEIDRRISRRDGSEWARLVFEDYQGTATALAFREAWARLKDTVDVGVPVLLRGQVSGRTRDENEPPVFVNEVLPLADVYSSGGIAVCLELEKTDELAGDRLNRVIEVAKAHPGPAALQIQLRNGGGDHPRLKSNSVSVSPTPKTLSALRKVLGPDRVRLVSV